MTNTATYILSAVLAAISAGLVVWVGRHERSDQNGPEYFRRKGWGG
jgi:hypothetical protein